AAQRLASRRRSPIIRNSFARTERRRNGPMPQNTRALLEELLAQRLLVLDGSMGALIYSRQPTEADYRGERFRNHSHHLKNCTEVMVLTQPKLIEGIHEAYLEAGADIIETDTFNGTRLALAEFGLEEH